MRSFVISCSTNRHILTLTVAGILCVLGCSDDGLAKRYHVTGKVTYNGQPLKKGTIVFVPTDPEGRGATGDIGEDGTYTLTTQVPARGVSRVVQGDDQR